MLSQSTGMAVSNVKNKIDSDSSQERASPRQKVSFKFDDEDKIRIRNDPSILYTDSKRKSTDISSKRASS